MNDLPKAPCVGESVVWYPHGDIDQEPFAATVVSRLSDDCITLYTLSPTGRREPMLNVKHVNHPDHDRAPQGVKRWGAWDLVGEHEKRKELNSLGEDKRRKEAMRLAEKSVTIDPEFNSNPDEDEMLIIRLSRELGDMAGRAQVVADKIGAGVTHQRVNSVLRDYPHLLSGELPEELIEIQI